MTAPDGIGNMTALRAEIDALDARIVAALATRARLIDRAVALKRIEGMPGRVPARVEQVVAAVRAVAKAEGLDPGLVEALWRQIIEWSIVREEAALENGDGA